MIRKLLTGLGTLGIAATIALGCDTPENHEVQLCKGALPQQYETFLENNPRIKENLIWADDEYPDGKQFADNCDKLKDLAAHITGGEPLTEPPTPIEFNEEADYGYYDEPAAWQMYLAHIAHSLKLEVEPTKLKLEKKLPWSLKDYSHDLLKLMFDGREFMIFKTDKSLYVFGSTDQGGRGGVTDWNPKVAYDFLQEQGMLTKNQLDTVYNLTQWVRENLAHFGSITPYNWDGYPGYPPLDKILDPPLNQNVDPPEDHWHWTYGCWGTTSFYIAMLHAVNIPVRRGHTIFSYTNPNREGDELHSRIEFPTLELTLVHGDDPYTSYNKRGENEVSVEDIFMTFEQVENLIDNPETPTENGYTPSQPEMASFNHSRYQIMHAYDIMADSLLRIRAEELLWQRPPSLEDHLVLRFCGDEDNYYQDCLWKPLFSDQERSEMTAKIDDKLREIGNGDLEEGCQRIISRWYETH